MLILFSVLYYIIASFTKYAVSLPCKSNNLFVVKRKNSQTMVLQYRYLFMKMGSNPPNCLGVTETVRKAKIQYIPLFFKYACL